MNIFVLTVLLLPYALAQTSSCPKKGIHLEDCKYFEKKDFDNVEKCTNVSVHGGECFNRCPRTHIYLGFMCSPECYCCKRRQTRACTLSYGWCRRVRKCPRNYHQTNAKCLGHCKCCRRNCITSSACKRAGGHCTHSCSWFNQINARCSPPYCKCCKWPHRKRG